MSRSYRLCFIKDNPKGVKRLHHRAYRRHVKQSIQSWSQKTDLPWEMEQWFDFFDDEDYQYISKFTSNYIEPEFKHPRTITNPYDICDYWWGYWIYTTKDPKDKPCGTYWYPKKSKNHIAK